MTDKLEQSIEQRVENLEEQAKQHMEVTDSACEDIWNLKDKERSVGRRLNELENPSTPASLEQAPGGSVPKP
jgi:archaellum component FlaC